jgi:hypothetical protein
MVTLAHQVLAAKSKHALKSPVAFGLLNEIRQTVRNGADIIAFLYASGYSCDAVAFVPPGAIPPGVSPWSLPLYPSVARVQPTAEYIHQLAGIFRVNCDLHQLSPGIIVGDNEDFVPVLLSVSRWADLHPEIRSLWHFPSSPI